MCGKRREMRKGNEKKMRREDRRESLWQPELVFNIISIMVLSGLLILEGN